MAAPRKHPEELRERATRMAVEARRDPATKVGALSRIGGQLGINPETLRNWVNQAEIDLGRRPGITTSDAERIAALERDNKELRRANSILRSASAFFAAELDRPAK
jgi:transposase